jgi:hypothetical protein
MNFKLNLSGVGNEVKHDKRALIIMGISLGDAGN